MIHPFKLKNAALLMALAAVYPMSAYSAAGVAQYTTGDVSVRRGAATSALAKGQAIDSGDNIVTGGQGVAQIRFSDGGLVALAPNSQFNIDRYVDDNDPAKDSFAVSFLRGGMRAISGLIGKRNRDNYKVTTNTATIGIRGSGFSARYNADGSTNFAGEQDEIVVCTNAGCINLLVGEIARVTGSDSAPSRTIARSNVPPLVPRQDLFTPENPPDIAVLPLPLANGVLSGVSALFAFGPPSSESESPYGFNDYYPRGGVDPSTGIGTFVDGQMTVHEVPGYNGGSVIVQKSGSGAGSFGQVGNPADSGFIGWGYWDAGAITSTGELMQPTTQGPSDGPEEFAGVHYIVGRPTPQIQMPISGTAVYSVFPTYGGLLSGTAPTATSYEGTSIFGTLLGAGLNVDFSNSRLTGYVDTEFVKNGQVVPVHISGSGYVDGSTFYANNDAFNGFFTGPQASRAGLIYQAEDETVGYVQGAVVLLKSGSATQVVNLQALFASNEELFDYFPNNTSQPVAGTGTFIGKQMYMHTSEDEFFDGEDFYSGNSALFAATSPVSSFGSLGNPTDADFIGWGYWAKGNVATNYYGGSSLTGVHYLVGRPAQQSQMPASGTATYSMAGGTAPTATLDGVTTVGRLDSAFLRDVNFGTGSMTIEVDTSFVKNGANVTVQLRESGYIQSGSRFEANGNCGGNVKGFFVGNQAVRAGMIYQQNSAIVSPLATMPAANIGIVQGAVALTRGAITPAPVVIMSP